ncbi:MAG: VWA domain-containing protein [Solirubrobacterales bacterium]|nr:VWA domain-containing protein [Solirubrobacterales bacterium]MBV9717237.1 VWA domain-containing protein [Solirubrobacterales bacterium]
MSEATLGPSASAAGDAVIERLALLAALLRALGTRVGMAELLSAHRALAAVDSWSRADARLALRTVLCSGREDLPRFDAAFLAVFGDGRVPPDGEDPFAALGSVVREVLPHAAIPGAAPPPAAEAADPMAMPAAWSDVELLREKDFASYTDEEVAVARELIARLARRGPRRVSRRTRPSRHRGHRPDLRRIVRSSLRTAGDPVERHWRASSHRPRPVVLVCDVSGSMTPYARMLLQYMHASVSARRRVEAFVFGTRLTRLTQELGGRDHDLALERATAAVTDFSGGTRIGAALAELNRGHGRRVGRGAVVVILSDGWDRGDPEVLDAEMARLRRSAHRLIWLNPLAAHPEFEPLTRGMRAAVPHTDELLAGNSLASLEELAVILEEI